MLETVMSDALTPLVAGAFKDLPSQQVFWGLVGAKAIDVLLGIGKAVLTKQIDPSELKKAPLSFLGLTLAAGVLMCLHLVSSQFDPLIGMAVMAMGASEGASILRNFAAICVAMGQPVPAWVNTMTSFLASVSSQGVNQMVADAKQPAVDVQAVPLTGNVPLSQLDPPAPGPTMGG